MSHAIVLTAAPAEGLAEGDIAAVRDQLHGAGPVRRLSDSAAEIPVPGVQRAARGGIDVNCVPLADRRKGLLIADMDSTMIPVECIDELADCAGVGAEVVAITEPAMRGEISFEDALTARVALLKDVPETLLAEVYATRIGLTSGARTLVQTMRAMGAYTALVSGGFTYFTERVAHAAGFHEHRANRLLIGDGRLAGTVALPILGRAAKLDALGEMTARLDLPMAATLAVGDGANDLAMIGAAGLGVAFRAKPVVAEAAGAAIRHGDLTALLYLQGIAEAEFAG